MARERQLIIVVDITRAVKALKQVRDVLAGIPIPWSETIMHAQLSRRATCTCITPPWKLYFTALPIRFCSIYACS
jgi:hypothetical protein